MLVPRAKPTILDFMDIPGSDQSRFEFALNQLEFHLQNYQHQCQAALDLLFDEDSPHYGRFDRGSFPFMHPHWGDPSTPQYVPRQPRHLLIYRQLDPGHTMTNAIPRPTTSPLRLTTFNLAETFPVERLFPWELNLNIAPQFLRSYLQEREVIDTEEVLPSNDLTGRYRLRHDPATGQPQLWFECACDEWPSPTLWLPLQDITYIDIRRFALFGRYCCDHANPYFAFAFYPEMFAPIATSMERFLKHRDDLFDENFIHFGRFD